MCECVFGINCAGFLMSLQSMDLGADAVSSEAKKKEKTKEVKKILQEILDDLNARRALYGKMLSNERLQVLDNEKKLNKWTNEVSEMTLEEYQDRKKIQMYGSKSQDAAGQVVLAPAVLRVDLVDVQRIVGHPVEAVEPVVGSPGPGGLRGDVDVVPGRNGFGDDLEHLVLGDDEGLIELYKPTYGEVMGLPDPKPNTVYVVSGMVNSATPERTDVVSPGEQLRDEEGRPIGCIGFRS